MDENRTQTASERLQPGVEDAHLNELPALLGAASALSQAVLAAMDPEAAQEILAQGELGKGFFQVDIQCTAPAEWSCYWVERREPPQRIAGGPGTSELEVDVIEGAAAFLAVAIAKITSQERLALAKVLAEGRGVVYVTVCFGPATAWRMAAHLQIWGGKAAGLYSIGPALHESPPERVH